MKLHVLALPHTQANPEWSTCAYTQKVVKFAKMFPDALVYSGEGADHAATHIETHSEAERVAWFGKRDENDTWGAVDWFGEGWQTFNERCAALLNDNLGQGDLILCTMGRAHEPVTKRFPDFLAIEPGVGYGGIFTEFCAFESHSWRAHLYGILRCEPRWYDTVIPNYFDPADFDFVPEHDGYLLYMGRMVPEKGVQIAADIAERAGVELLTAGAGNCIPEYATHIGVAGPQERRVLLRHAMGVLTPSTYLEPFGGVAVEAMMSGVPVIASDWGGFADTVHSGFNGWRIQTISEGVRCVHAINGLDRAAIREEAQRFSIDAIRPQFNRWFENLSSLYGDGFYA
jgi:glycosyltransferase involved in cell wall biosynthesis